MATDNNKDEGLVTRKPETSGGVSATVSKLLHSKILVLFVVAAVVLGGAGFWLWQNGHLGFGGGGSSVELEEFCQGEDIENISCKATYFRNLAADDGVAAALARLDDLGRDSAQISQDCYFMAYGIGRVAGGNHSGLAEAYAQGDEICSSGYFHGATETIVGAMSTDDITANTRGFCNSDLVGSAFSSRHYDCAYGAGLGFMRASGNELFDSLETCDLFDITWESESCYGGVYYANIMAYSPDSDHSHTEYLREDEPLYPCTEVDDKYKKQCFNTQTSFALRVLDGDFSEVFALCDAAAAGFRDHCYNSIGRDASASTAMDIEETKAICLLGSNNRAQSGCAAGAAINLLTFHGDDTEALSLCSSFDGDIAAACEQRVGKYRNGT